jgi:hypothetical protein
VPYADNVESSLLSRGQRLREFLIRPTRRKLTLSEFTGYDAKLGWQGVQPALQSNAALFLGLLIGTTFLLQGGAIHFAIRTTSWFAFGLALLGVVGGAVLIGSLFFKSGFSGCGAVVLKDGVVRILTVLAFVLPRCCWRSCCCAGSRCRRPLSPRRRFPRGRYGAGCPISPRPPRSCSSRRASPA